MEDTLDIAGCRRPLLAALLDAARSIGYKQVIAGDMMVPAMNYRQLLLRQFILAGRLQPFIGVDKFVAILLPNSIGVLVTFVSLHALGRIPCMLNFSAGEANVLHACRIACVKTVLTSRVFVEKAKLESLVAVLEKEHAVIYLEDIRKHITIVDKMAGALKAFFPGVALKKALSVTRPDDPAVIIYTSGSEGTPKGVALSHSNILSNIAQVFCRLEFSPKDIIFNALPVFHSFGLTVGTLMPVWRGLKTCFYPSPVLYRQIPKAVRETGATIMLGTDTFYQGYARYAEPGDFSKIRLAVAGAEKLKDTTLNLWKEKIGVHILQGYGVSEASPVVSCNTPSEYRDGTVGRPFPAIETRLEPVTGLARGGRLFIKGPNVMLGYLKTDKPGVIQPQGEWYDTGDIVEIDGEGFIRIQGRAKRFAKIGGEMVSLQAVEDLACAINAETAHAAIAVPDDRKGEQIVLFTEDKTLTREQLLQLAQKKGVAEIALPKQVTYMETIPRLGNGKINYMVLSAK